MRKYKVLISDEDVLARQVVANVLQSKTDHEIIVSNQSTDLEENIDRFDPDVLLLSLDEGKLLSMPQFDQTRQKHPELPIVVMTKRTKEGAEIAMNALRKGAIDFVTKPEQQSILLFASNHLIKRLCPIIDMAAKRSAKHKIDRLLRLSLSSDQKDFEDLENQTNEAKIDWPVRMITIGACTGGPKALFELIPKLPAELAVPVVIAQHFPKHYTKALAERLDKLSKIKVEEAYDGVELKPGNVWILPGGYHGEIQQDGVKTSLKLHRGPREKGFRPSIDLLFRSVGKAYGPAALGIILSGCGVDGLEGVAEIKKQGGKVIVQDPRTAMAYSLPLSVIKAGLADGMYAVNEIGAEIIERTSRWEQAVRRKKKKFSVGTNASDLWHEIEA